ncbi:hypothetical protein F5X98DRAFT_15082 [Xylaria grammica]|nr:hypothetical protein F5X98DRAFT_15082 [Xylaria grammica]
MASSFFPFLLLVNVALFPSSTFSQPHPPIHVDIHHHPHPPHPPLHPVSASILLAIFLSSSLPIFLTALPVSPYCTGLLWYRAL